MSQRYGGHQRAAGPAYGSLHGGYSAPAPAYGGGHHDDYVSNCSLIAHEHKKLDFLELSDNRGICMNFLAQCW